MSILTFLKVFNRNSDLYSQSGQDQFAYNLCGNNGTYLEIGAYHPVLNSNTYHLETKCNWRGLSIEIDLKWKNLWDKNVERRNEIIWDNVFNLELNKILKEKNFNKRINYLSCDIETPAESLKILKKLINDGLAFDYISLEHDKYKIGDLYEKKGINYLLKNDYKVAVKDVYSRNKKKKIYETWFVHNDRFQDELSYDKWKLKYFKNSIFIK